MLARIARERRAAMPAILGLVLVCGGLAGCESPTETRAPLLGKPALPPPSFVITAPVACGQVQFTITGSSSVTTTFPAAGCGSGLVLVSGGTTTWNGTTRILSLRVKVKNTSGQTVEQPIWTQLPDTGRLVTAPAGQPRTQIVPMAPADTLESGGTTVWLVGSSTNLANGSSTPARILKFQMLSPVTSGTLSFRMRTNEIIVGFPATAPNVTPGWFYHDSSKTSGQVVKRALVVSFKAGVTVPEKQAAIDGVQGTVVGGSPLFGAADEGRYLVRVPWATSGRLIDSAARVVMTNPTVRYAGKYWFVVFNGRRPIDHYSGAPTWTRADWVFNPDSSSGSNWAPEEAALPLAWGCETGSPSTQWGLSKATSVMGISARTLLAAFRTQWTTSSVFRTGGRWRASWRPEATIVSAWLEPHGRLACT